MIRSVRNRPQFKKKEFIVFCDTLFLLEYILYYINNRIYIIFIDWETKFHIYKIT